MEIARHYTVCITYSVCSCNKNYEIYLENILKTQCFTNIYSNIVYQILDIQIQILKFIQLNILGYSNKCHTIFEYLNIQLFIQLKHFSLFEALFVAALGRLLL